MKIFSASEEEAFEAAPVFNSAERKRFFCLPHGLSDSAAALRTPTNRVRFLLAAGYFKARHKFFNRQYHADSGSDNTFPEHIELPVRKWTAGFRQQKANEVGSWIASERIRLRRPVHAAERG